MIVVIWIDWYAYHHARLRALTRHPRIGAQVTGIELVGKTGVHKGLVFREIAEPSLPLITLMPGADWSFGVQRTLVAKLWKKLNELNPAIVLVPGYYTLPALTAAIWGRFRGRRTVLMTESTQHDHARTPWKEALKAVMLRVLFSGAIAGGKAHLRYLAALNFPTEKVGKCYDVVDNDFFSGKARDLRSRSGADKPSPYFLYVGRLAPEKNLKVLIRAFAAYQRAGGAWKLVLVGGGPEEDSLRLEAAAQGCSDQVLFAGMKASAELPEHYAFAGCFVLPSSLEPWGLVTNEAMASGLPVIVSNRCGCAEDLVMEGENGFLFDPENVSELKLHMLTLSEMSTEAAGRMGRKSQEIIQNYSPQCWANEIADMEMEASR